MQSVLSSSRAGNVWRESVSPAAVVLLLFLGCAHAAGLDPSAPSVPIANYTTSWLGNSLGGPTWVQRYTNDLFTAPDGTCYEATTWDEGGREFGIYRDGQVLGKADDSHGWGYGGGGAVTANGKYLFVAQMVGHMGDDSGKIWPPKGTTWYGIGRRHLDGSLAPFPGGTGHGATEAGGSFVSVNAVTHPPAGTAAPAATIAGLAVSETQLFAANSLDGQIDIFDAESMQKTGGWPCPGATHVAYDATSPGLWVLQKDQAGAAKIRHFTLAGLAAGPDIPLPADAAPSAFCLGPGPELVVADAGPAQQVLVYRNIETAPALVSTLGAKGGIYSGVPGRVEPLKFSSPVGIGCDGAGNVYVASFQNGTVLESCTPAGTRNWEVHGLEFVECADLDPADPTQAYTQDHHYTLDPTRPSGQDSTYVGYLVNPLASPGDPRVQGWGGGSTFVRRIQGKLFLFTTNMNAGDLEVYRFTGQGESTALATLIMASTQAAKWPPANHPATSGWIWRDSTGAGSFSPENYLPAPSGAGTTAWSVDDHGDVWLCYSTTLKSGRANLVRHFPVQGLDASGDPIYTYASAIDTAVPAPFDGTGGVERMQYVAADDTMYLSGFTADHKNLLRDWKTSGPVICCFDHWSKVPTLRWQIVVPFESVAAPHTTDMCPDAFSVAGDRLFNGYLKNGEIRVYDTRDGSYLGSLLPGPEVDHTSGWIDTMYGVRANQLKPGDYLVFAEEVWHEKVLMYRLHSPEQ